MSFSRMKLAMKLAMGFGLILLLLCIVAYIGMRVMTNLKDEVVEISDIRIPQLEIVNDITTGFDLSARAVRNLPLTSDDNVNKREKENYEKGKANVNEALNKLEKLLTTTKGRELFNNLKENYIATAALMDKAVALGAANKNEEAADVILNQLVAVQNKFLAVSEALTDFQVQVSRKAADEAVAAASNGRILSVVFGGAALVLGAILAFFITRSVTKPIQRIAEGLAEASDQVAAASGQVSSASQQLAEGSSEQAASIEETSSSLEEMASMTRQNADHAGQANQLMQEVHQIVSGANQSMAKLTASMAEISSASDETQKIIKTIDEIAFQTNLLALNAAVEAARAGEAGAGFAVVADEVRNLAMRAAEAAKNTAGLIEGTVKTVKGGSELAETTGSEFQKVAASSSKMAELVSEIAAASHEQAQGIGQIDKAVSEMDKIVQQNSANAEESASASEEMNAQAEQMKSYVQELLAVIGGSHDVDHEGRGSQFRGQSRRTVSVVANRPKANSQFDNRDPKRRAKATATYAGGTKPLESVRLIPPEGEDF